MIRLSIRPGHALDKHALDELYAIRGRFMRLKPGVEPAIDRAKFDRFMLGASHILCGHDENRELRMTIVVDRREITVGGRDIVVHIGEYGYLDLDYRGHPGLLFLYFRVAASDLLSSTPVYACGIGYPTSMLALARFFGTPILPGPTNTAIEEACFADIAQRLGGDDCDVRTGRTVMRTVPPEPPAWWWEHIRHDPNYAAFIERCPDWEKGFGLLGMFRLDASTLARVATGAVRRTAMHLRRRGLRKPRVAPAIAPDGA